VTSLTQIVEDVLDVSRIVSGKIRLNVQRQLTEMHGGTIEAASGGRDAGATFRLAGARRRSGVPHSSRQAD
jgi:signal transduction histidine kinase